MVSLNKKIVMKHNKIPFGFLKTAVKLIHFVHFYEHYTSFTFGSISPVFFTTNLT